MSSVEPAARGSELDTGRTTMTNSVGEPAGELQRGGLGFAGNFVMSLANVGPTVSIALSLAALVAVSSYASPLAVLICAIPMLGIAIAFRRLNMWQVNCGSTYIWSARAISPYFGWMVGWIIILAYVIGATSVSYPIGSYALSIFSTSESTSAVGSAAIGTVAIIVVTIIAYIGIRAASRFQTVLILVEYSAIGVLAVLGLIGIFGGGAHSAHFRLSWFSWHSMGGVSGLVNASLIAVFMYSGWDMAVTLNEETEDSSRTPGRAVITTVLVSALLYTVLTFALQGAVSHVALEGHADNALSYIAGVLGDTVLAKIMIFAVLLSAVGSLLAAIVSGGRIGFAMGRDNVLPPLFGHTHPRHKTPVNAMIVVALFALIWIWLYASGSTAQGAFSAVVSSDGLLFALFYAATGLAVAVYYRKMAMTGVVPFLEVALFPLASAAFLMYMIVRSVPGLGGWGGKSLIYLYVLLGLGVVLMVYSRLRHDSDYFRTPVELFEPSEVRDPSASPGR